MFSIILIALGLAMDSFSVSLASGTATKQPKIKEAIIISIFFGFFQGTMPVIGYIIGSAFKYLIINIDHWIAFLLLAIIGIRMIYDSF